MTLQLAAVFHDVPEPGPGFTREEREGRLWGERVRVREREREEKKKNKETEED